MPSAKKPLEATGLEDLLKSEPTLPASVDEKVRTDNFVYIKDLGEDFQAKVPEVNQPAAVAAKVKTYSKTEYDDAEAENSKRNFTLQLLEARTPKEPPPAPPPAIAPQMAERTRMEMEAGRKRVAEFAAEDAKRPKRQVENPTMTPVFRPADYVPDPKKGQGVIAARTLATQ